jgi:rfaE bifunctional protein kinase chain/domain
MQERRTLVTERRLREILASITTVSVGVIGDFCLDAYWELDLSNPEASIETGKPTRAVAHQRYGLGGAGNIASNAATLGAGSVHAFGVIGNDLFGREMMRLLERGSIITDGILTQQQGFDTPVYAKPLLGAEEQERIDFGRFNSVSDETTNELAGRVRRALTRMDALIVNQQLLHGVCSPRMFLMLNDFAAEVPEKILIADSRHRSHLIRSMIRKLNASEALRSQHTPAGADVGDALRACAFAIASTTHHPVFITRGSAGMLACDGASAYDVPAVMLRGEIDPVGAGDTAVAAIACTLAAGASVPEAAEAGNLAAAITVQKLRQTGAASPVEILSLFSAGIQQS